MYFDEVCQMEYKVATSTKLARDTTLCPKGKE